MIRYSLRIPHTYPMPSGMLGAGETGYSAMPRGQELPVSWWRWACESIGKSRYAVPVAHRGQ